MDLRRGPARTWGVPRALPILLFALLIAGCGAAERELTRSTAPAWTEHPLPERGATVSLPEGWMLARIR